jgi:ABC-type phosphate transport system substrate-binding protein
MRKLLAGSRGYRAIGFLLVAASVGACTVLLDRNKNQCSTDDDCETAFNSRPSCQNNVCVDTGLQPKDCFLGTPSTPEEFANQCSSTATCERFDNCEKAGMCDGNTMLPPLIAPPAPMTGGSGAPPPPAQGVACIDPARKTVIVGGSTAIQPFLSVLAPLLATNSPPYQIVYQPSGSCTGVDGLFSPDSAKRNVKDIPGRQALLFHLDGTFEPCTFGDGSATAIALDVAASDVYASSCTASYSATSLGEYLGPIQPMTFVVPGMSSETAISAEKAHLVFGRGSSDGHSKPYDDPSLYFVRNSGSGTQQMLARAIGVEAKSWWGTDRGGSGAVRDLLKVINGTRVDNAIGILSTDFVDPVRPTLRILAFKATDQTCGYYPDSTQFTRDKANVRDGHYAIWGPVHFYTEVNGGVPRSEGAQAFISRVAPTRLDKPLLDAIIHSGLVPPCAMKVQRTSEMGPITAFAPEFQCGCYFEANVEGGTVPDSCQACAGPGDCPSSKPACNNGYCELK